MKLNRLDFAAVLAALLILPGSAFVPESIANPFGVSLHASAQPPQQEDEFVPLKDLGNQEQLPATPLVIGAYAVAWIAVFVYLWSIWRRLSSVEREMASLSRRIGEDGAGARK